MLHSKHVAAAASWPRLVLALYGCPLSLSCPAQLHLQPPVVVACGGVVRLQRGLLRAPQVLLRTCHNVLQVVRSQPYSTEIEKCRYASTWQELQRISVGFGGLFASCTHQAFRGCGCSSGLGALGKRGGMPSVVGVPLLVWAAGGNLPGMRTNRL